MPAEPFITAEHRAARRRRAELMALAIEHVGGTPEGASKLPHTGWLLCIEQVRILNPAERIDADYYPHWHTRQLCIRMLTDWRTLRTEAKQRAAGETVADDPFKGLPS
jgi:hypothetical protein